MARTKQRARRNNGLLANPKWVAPPRPLSETPPPRQVEQEIFPRRFATLTSSQRSKLCERCANLNMSAIFRDSRHKPSPGWGRLYKWYNHDCSLCRMLLGCLFEPVDDETSFPENIVDAEYLFSVTKSTTTMGFVIDATRASLITLSADTAHTPFQSYISLQRDTIRPFRVLGELIDFKVLRGWLQQCHKRHSGSCGQLRQTVDPVRSLISSFRLIHCRSRRLVAAHVMSEQYAALSYVWGANCSAEDVADQGRLPKDLPATIEDALKATLGLGLNYLWIDRYCIQNDAAERHDQIAKMDLIYSQAHITLIAAAGEDPNYGLPGVYRRPRASQSYVQYGSLCLVQPPPDHLRAILETTWMRRAWTFQEALLSRRRLFFTDHQVFYDCSAMHCYESLHVRGIPSSLFSRDTESPEWEVFQRIAEYSQRMLSFPSDILNGILGVLRMFEVGALGVRHIMGIPLYPLNDVATLKAAREARAAHCVSKSVLTSAGFCIGLCWDTEFRSRRRTGFPSWSWTGWVGEVSWPIRGRYLQNPQGDSSLQVNAYLQDGQYVDWSTLQQCYDELAPKLTGQLLISGWTLDVLPPSNTHRARDGYSPLKICQTGILVNKCTIIPWDFSLTGGGRVTKRPCLALRLAFEKDVPDFDNYVLVLQEIEEGIYERIGLGRTRRLPAAQAPGSRTFDFNLQGYKRKRFRLQ